MTVKELREELENYPEDWDVVMWGSAEVEGTEVHPLSAPFIATVKAQGRTAVVLE